MNADPAHVLVVDDDDRLRQLLGKYLTGNGFMVTTAQDAADAREKMARLVFDILVLDLMMPGENGLDFAASIRRSSDVPILMLTAMSESGDRIKGLESGADDYLTKPFEPRELLLRVNNVLRRVAQSPAAEPGGDAEIVLGDFHYDLGRGVLSQDGRQVRLTEVEVALLTALAERPGQVLTREDLIDITGASVGGRAVDVQVTRLRRKIETDPRQPRYLQTVRGKGYVLRPD